MAKSFSPTKAPDAYCCLLKASCRQLRRNPSILVSSCIRQAARIETRDQSCSPLVVVRDGLDQTEHRTAQQCSLQASSSALVNGTLKRCRSLLKSTEDGSGRQVAIPHESTHDRVMKSIRSLLIVCCTVCRMFEMCKGNAIGEVSFAYQRCM